MSKTLTREDILAAAAKPVPREAIDIPELGGRVWIRGMTGAERDQYEHDNIFINRRGKVQQNADNLRARLAVRCLVDEDGNRLLTDADAPALGMMRSDVLAVIFEKAQRLSGVTDGDLDELKKGSAAADGIGSSSSSVSNSGAVAASS